MKQIVSLTAACLLFLSACASPSAGQPVSLKEDAGSQLSVEDSSDSAAVPSETVHQEEELIDDEGWEQLAGLGKVETENGLFYVSITVPAEMAGEVSQEDIDAKAGDTYTSGKVNEDGSVTYRMTKKQHKAMLDAVSSSIDENLQELTDSADYSIAKIDHNDDYSVFDVTLDTEEVGLAEAFMDMGFYIYGGMYSLFTGHDAEKIIVNYYGPDGTLIESSDSSAFGG